MTEILHDLEPVAAGLTPGAFARMCPDFDFNGTATYGEMITFWRLAWGTFDNNKRISMQATLRSTSLFRLKSLLNLDTSTHFPNLNVKIVFYQVVIRLLSPKRVNQMDFGLCGPIHFTIVVIKTKPFMYVDTVADLLTKGVSFGANGMAIQPGKAVKNFDPGTSIPQADWLIAGSMFNLKHVPTSTNEQAEWGGTRGPDVALFCKHFGFPRYVALTPFEDTGAFFLDKLAYNTVLTSSYEDYYPKDTRNVLDLFFNTKGLNLVDPEISIRLAQTLHSAGWHVLLKINASWAASEDVTNIRERVMKKYGSTYETYKLMYTQKEELEREWEKLIISKVKLEEKLVKEGNAKIVSTLEERRTVLKFIPTSSANHWVLVKLMSFDDVHHTIKLTLYTWGGTREPLTVPLSSFLKGYSGFVATIGDSTLSSTIDSALSSLGKRQPPSRSLLSSSVHRVVHDPLLTKSNRGRVVRVNPDAPRDLATILKQDELEAQQALLLRKQLAPSTSDTSPSKEKSSSPVLKKKSESLLGSHYYTEEDMFRLMNHYVGGVPNVVVLHGISDQQFARLDPAAYRHSTHPAIDDLNTQTILQPLNVHGNHWGLLYIRQYAPGMGGVRPARVLYIDPLNPGDVPDLSPLRRAFSQLSVERSTIRYQDDGGAQHSCGAWIVVLAQCLIHYNDVLPPAEDTPRTAAIELRQMHQEVLEGL